MKSHRCSSFRDYYLTAFLRPKQAFSQLVGDRRKVEFGFKAFLVAAVGYTMVYIFLTMGGGQPWKPWLAIPHDVYYKWDQLMCAPSMVAAWILSSGVGHLLSRVCGGKGSFEDMLSVFGFGIGIASWATLVHDWTTSLLGGIHVIDQSHYEVLMNTPTIWRDILWFTMISYLIWFAVIFTKGVIAAQGIKRGPAALIGTFSFLVYQLIFFVFNR